MIRLVPSSVLTGRISINTETDHEQSGKNEEWGPVNGVEGESAVQ